MGTQRARSSRSIGFAAAVVLLVGGVPLVGCTGGDASTSSQASTDPGTATASVGRVELITAEPADALEDALIVGSLSVISGCVLIDASEGGLGVVVIQVGTTWDTATSSVVDPDGSAVAVSEPVGAQGGGHDLVSLEHYLDPPSLGRARDCAAAAGVERAFVIGEVAPAASPAG